MHTLKEVITNPSGFDSLANYIGEIPEDTWLVVLTRNRDSDILTESNWDVALRELGGESDNVRIDRFGHWACGWWESLSVKANTKEAEIGESIQARIEDYPVLDDDDYSEKETEVANEAWQWYSIQERIEYLREYGTDNFHDLADMLACIRGQYAPFTNAGYEGLLY